MAFGGPTGDEAQRAWKRLAKRLGEPAADAVLTGDRALHALADISTVRRTLDQAELTAVRAARRQAKSWAEIATHLGVTRQSAWERWRDLDDDTGPIAGAATEAVERVRSKATAIPDVVGLSVTEARAVLQGAGFVPGRHVPGEAPDLELPPDGTVVDQVPEAGAKRRPGSTIALWIERGGGSSGVREPRRPTPTPKAGRAL